MPIAEVKRRTINVLEPEYDRFIACCKENNDLKHAAFQKALLYRWDTSTPDEQFSALRFGNVPAANIVGISDGNINERMTRVQQKSLDLRSKLDELLKDGNLCAKDKRILRRMHKDLDDAVNNVGVEFNEASSLAS